MMVNAVQDALPPGHTLAVGTCLRTPDQQQKIRDHFTDKLRAEHPEWSTATLNRTLNRMIAPLDRGAPAPHTTGAALDVGIDGPDGKPLRFSPSDDFFACAATYSDKLDDHTRANRIILIRAMEDAGLTNYTGEWWHWSYGDQGWALRVGSPIAYYGPVSVENADELRIPEPEKPENLSESEVGAEEIEDSK
jgi:D-alanyl-D-alanine dipeptidase